MTRAGSNFNQALFCVFMQYCEVALFNPLSFIIFFFIQFKGYCKNEIFQPKSTKKKAAQMTI